MYRGINFAINANFDRYFYKKSCKTEEEKKHQTHLVMVIFVFVSYLVAADFQSNCLGKVSL